jgi:hypothetical protein
MLECWPAKCPDKEVPDSMAHPGNHFKQRFEEKASLGVGLQENRKRVATVAATIEKAFSVREDIAVFAVSAGESNATVWRPGRRLLRGLNSHSRRKRATFVPSRQDVLSFRASMNTYSRK